MKPKGITLVEVLVAMAISLVLSLMIYYAVRHSSESYVINKKLSDLIETARTTEVQLKYFFDRWGVGVPEDPNSLDCSYDFNTNINNTQFPKSKYCLMIENGEPCDKLSFYYGTPGYTVVLYPCPSFEGACHWCENDMYPPEDFFAVYACYMENEEGIYYYVWRKKKVINITEGSKLGVYGGWCGIGGDVPNGCVSYVIPNAEGVWEIILQDGDMILRVPNKVTFYCDYGDDGNLYLYVDEDYNAGEKEGPPPYPIARVKSVKIEKYPADCIPKEGNCAGVKFTIKFVDTVKLINGEEKEIILKREMVFGR